MRILLILVLAVCLSSEAHFTYPVADIETLPRKETRASICSSHLRDYTEDQWNEREQKYPDNEPWMECMGVGKK
jgi:hypothetical protein